MQELLDQRDKLTLALNICSRDAFPVTKAWYKENAAINALAAFDAAHPEVIAHIQRAHQDEVLGVEG